MSTPVFQSERNFSQVKMEIKINEDASIYAKRQVETSGVFGYGQRYWLQSTKPELIKETLKGTANSIAPGARLINYKIENIDDLDKDIVLEYEFQAPELLAKAGKSRLLPQLGGIDIAPIVKEERNYPIEYPTFFETINIIKIELPQNLVIKYLPQDLKINSDWIEFENIYTKEDRIISFYSRYRLKRKFILQEEYKEYKELIEDIARNINQRINLEEISDE